jgi:hypothetical protein
LTSFHTKYSQAGDSLIRFYGILHGCTKISGLENRRSIRLSYGTGLKYQPLHQCANSFDIVLASLDAWASYTMGAGADHDSFSAFQRVFIA